MAEMSLDRSDTAIGLEQVRPDGLSTPSSDQVCPDLPPAYTTSLNNEYYSEQTCRSQGKRYEISDDRPGVASGPPEAGRPGSEPETGCVTLDSLTIEKAPRTLRGAQVIFLIDT